MIVLGKTMVAGAGASIAQVLLVAMPFLVHAEERAQVVSPATSKTDVATLEDLQKNCAGFRGFGAIGHAPGARPPLRWSASVEENILWKTPLAKHGMSSPVVWQNRIFLIFLD